MDDEQVVTTPAQHAALGHPLRQRLLLALGQGPSTISRLAGQLQVGKGSVAHHLRVLREAGLVVAAERRQVRGGTEQYYQRTTRRLVSADPQPSHTAAVLNAVATDIAASPVETTLQLRQVRLSAKQAHRLTELLTRLVDKVEEADTDEPVHGVLVAVYQKADEPRDPSS
ncbi:ArsR/SmtB family transcription factor [Angustibacter luteus]|uniref:ArsR/SmtB family transcription factor n=1 Tax=Angustibacter luteus TaxID=658456 RepID=A0ABW1JB79_9ACTN